MWGFVELSIAHERSLDHIWIQALSCWLSFVPNAASYMDFERASEGLGEGRLCEDTFLCLRLPM